MTDLRETSPRFAGIGGHHSNSAGTVDWITPKFIVEALGPFDLDPCASMTQPWPTASRRYTREDNGLIKPWEGRVWLNPPYSAAEVGRWLARLADHGRGTALIFARTETRTFFRFVWERADALLFLRGRISFHRPDGSLPPADEGGGNAGAPSVLCAYGEHDAEKLAACGLGGAFVRIRRVSVPDTSQWEMAL